MKKLLFLIFIICMNFTVKAQTGDAKYVQIKQVYDFQDKFNEYRVNSFLKHQFEEAGYIVFYDNQELPSEVSTNPCKLLKCNVTRDKSMLATKLQLSLIDCNNRTVYTANGESRIKKRSKSHVDALKNALQYAKLPVVN